MIVDVRKFLIYGAKEEMNRFFDLAQHAGYIEFIGIWHKKALELPLELKNYLSALKILRLWVGGTAGIEMKLPSNPAHLAEKVVELNASLERLNEEQRVLHVEIARIAPFGDFSKSDLESLQKESRRFVQFFCMKSSIVHDVPLPGELIYIGTQYDLDYYVAINPERTQYPKMIELLIDQPVGVLKERLQDVRTQVALLEAQLRSCFQYIPYLQEGLVDGLNAHHLSSAKHDASHPMGDALFAIEAWVPKTKIRGLKALIADLSIECEQIAIEPFDRVPTCIENSGAGKIGEDLVQIYDTPAATDKDPSTWVVAFFSLFFAMIISDAGYGLLYLSLGLFLKWKCSQATGVLRRMIKLLLILGVTTTLWGIMSASYFGVEVGPKNSLRKLSVINYFATRKADYVVNTKGSIYREYIKLYPQAASAANGEELIAKAEVQQGGHTEYPVLTDLSNNVLMEFSLLIGIIHLSCSFARSLRRNWSGIGWILFLFGGYLYFPTSMLDATSLVEFMGLISKPVAHFVGEQMLLIGLGFVLVAAAIQHGMAAALGELLHVVQVFGDVLSYLRLYALGLAGMIVASTFNSLGSQFGIVPGVLILLAGHLLNLNLSVMSGVIHGLRLNFLEWYRYSFQGGGKNFNPLRLIRKN